MFKIFIFSFIAATISLGGWFYSQPKPVKTTDLKKYWSFNANSESKPLDRSPASKNTIIKKRDKKPMASAAIPEKALEEYLRTTWVKSHPFVQEVSKFKMKPWYGQVFIELKMALPENFTEAKEIISKNLTPKKVSLEFSFPTTLYFSLSKFVPLKANQLKIDNVEYKDSQTIQKRLFGLLLGAGSLSKFWNPGVQKSLDSTNNMSNFLKKFFDNPKVKKNNKSGYMALGLDFTSLEKTLKTDNLRIWQMRPVEFASARTPMLQIQIGKGRPTKEWLEKTKRTSDWEQESLKSIEKNL